MPSTQTKLSHTGEASVSLAEGGSGHQLDFNEFYEKYAPLVTRWIYRLGGASMDREDVVQEVFCVVHRRLKEWDGEGNVTTWLFRITHHVLRNWTRKQRFY